MASRPPHIVIFNPDQWRGDVLGHMGNPGAVTPALDELVRTSAVSFRNAFVQSPVCTPSRCSYMTGWYPHVRGHRTMHHMLHAEHGEPVLLKRLKEAGYFVWWGGKNDLVPAERGFEEFCNVKHECSEEVERGSDREYQWRGEPQDDNYYSFFLGKLPHTPGHECYYDTQWSQVMDAVKVIHNAPKDKPLCIYLPLAYPHPPYAVEDPFFSMIDRSRIPQRIPAPRGWAGKPSVLKGIWERQNMQGWTEDRWRELRATYYGMCARTDHQFSLIIEALRHAGIYDRTAVFFFSDHGDFTGDYGLVEKTQNTFEDCLTRVPFIIKPPSDVPIKPGISEALVELIDFTATVEAISGIEQDYDHFGRSLLPILLGQTDKHRDAVFCEGGRRYGEFQCMERESLVGTGEYPEQDLYWPRLGLQVQDDGPEHTKACMCRTEDFKYVLRLYESDELYDLRNDPWEQHNVVDNPDYKDILSRMNSRALTFFLETADVVPREIDKRWKS